MPDRQRQREEKWSRGQLTVLAGLAAFPQETLTFRENSRAESSDLSHGDKEREPRLSQELQCPALEASGHRNVAKAFSKEQTKVVVGGWGWGPGGGGCRHFLTRRRKSHK